MTGSRIFLKIAASGLGLLLLGLGVPAFLMERELKGAFLGQVEGELAQEARRTAVVIRPMIESGDPRGAERLLRELARSSGTRYTIIGEDGVVLADSHHDHASMENHGNRPEVRMALLAGQGRSERPSATTGREEMYVAVAERLGGHPVVIRASEALSDVNTPFLRARRWVLGAGVTTVALGVGLGLWMARRLATPIREMQAMAGAVARGERGARLRSTRHDELGELARSLDHLAEELEARVEAMSRDRERALAMLSAMAEGIVALDGAGRVTSVNRAAEELFGVRGADVLGRRLAEAIRAAELLDLAEEVLRDRTPSEREARLGERVLQLTGSPMGGPSGGAVLLAHDLTEVRRLEEVRRDFVANFSHEIRTPLSAILGYVETLLHAAPEDPAQRDEFLQKIQKNAHRLRELASDVLTLSRVEARPDLTDRSSVDIGEVANLSLEAWRERAEAKGLRLENEMDHGPFLVLGDRGLLLTALDNLLQNAITYTPSGGRVVLSVRRQGDRVRAAVRDTGIGIPSAYLPRIFERFFRVDRGRSREVGGTGLGLAIVKHVALNHGGSVVATSEEGRGTEVALELPVADRGLERVA